MLGTFCYQLPRKKKNNNKFLHEASGSFHIFCNTQPVWVFNLSVTWSPQARSDFKGNEESYPLLSDCLLTRGLRAGCQHDTHLWLVSGSNPTMTPLPPLKKQASYGVMSGFLAPMDTGDTGESNIRCSESCP